jgi:tripartite-type tricarboxylate transporter receptor subunit TctC
VDVRLVTHSCASTDVRTSLAELGIEAKIGTAQDFAAAPREQAHEWKTVIEATGVEVE